MTPLSAHVPRLPHPVPMPARAMPAPFGSPAARDGAEAGPDQRRHAAQPAIPDRGPGVSAETMGRVIGMLRRLASAEDADKGMAAEARQVLSLLGAPQPQGAEAARRVRLDVMA
jgi:hypothetical protein